MERKNTRLTIELLRVRRQPRTSKRARQRLRARERLEANHRMGRPETSSGGSRDASQGSVTPPPRRRSRRPAPGQGPCVVHQRLPPLRTHAGPGQNVYPDATRGQDFNHHCCCLCPRDTQLSELLRRRVRQSPSPDTLRLYQREAEIRARSCRRAFIRRQKTKTWRREQN